MRPSAFLTLAALAALAGASFVVQAAVNANLRSSLGSAFWAAFVSYAGGTLVMAVVLLLARAPWPKADAVWGSAWLSWTGGLWGSGYVVVLILLLPRLGAAATLSLFIAGQMLVSVAFDQFGVLGVPRQPVDLFRVAGAALVVCGVALIRS